jgi:hypothetical protein
MTDRHKLLTDDADWFEGEAPPDTAPDLSQVIPTGQGHPSVRAEIAAIQITHRGIPSGDPHYRAVSEYQLRMVHEYNAITELLSDKLDMNLAVHPEPVNLADDAPDQITDADLAFGHPANLELPPSRREQINALEDDLQDLQNRSRDLNVRLAERVALLRRHIAVIASDTPRPQAELNAADDAANRAIRRRRVAPEFTRFVPPVVRNQPQGNFGPFQRPDAPPWDDGLEEDTGFDPEDAVQQHQPDDPNPWHHNPVPLDPGYQPEDRVRSDLERGLYPAIPRPEFHPDYQDAELDEPDPDDYHPDTAGPFNPVLQPSEEEFDEAMEIIQGRRR